MESGRDSMPNESNQPSLQGPRPGRGRRPAAEVRAAVMTAAGSLLFEEGISGVTFEKVAARAGASKMTLYKWWHSPSALAFDAYFDSLQETLTFPDTGDVLADLRTQLHAFVDVLTDQARAGVIAGLIGAAQSDPELARELNARYTAPRRELAAATLELGKLRGQIKQEVDSETLIDQLWGACYHRLLLPVQPLSHHFADRLISNLYNGIDGTGTLVAGVDSQL
jgi:AcrR family transcriptional regulator